VHACGECECVHLCAVSVNVRMCGCVCVHMCGEFECVYV